MEIEHIPENNSMGDEYASGDNIDALLKNLQTTAYPSKPNMAIMHMLYQIKRMQKHESL